MAEKNIIIITDMMIEDQPEYSLEELCIACDVTVEFIQETVEYGVIELENDDLQDYRFDIEQLKRIRTAIHLQRDLEINLPGVALVLDLMEEIEHLRSRVELFEKHLKPK